MNISKTINIQRSTSRQPSLDSRSASPWNRRSDIFKLSSTSHVHLGPQEEEIDRIYLQMHTLMEILNEKIVDTTKKKEENCLFAFKKVMRSIDRDLKDIRQQLDDVQKTTKEEDEDQKTLSLRKQLTFFRDESIILSKKLKEAESTIKELRRKNDELEFEARIEHKMLLKSEKELQSIKNLLNSQGTEDYESKLEDQFLKSKRNREMNTKSQERSVSRGKLSPEKVGKSRIEEAHAESKDQHGKVHVHLLRFHLEQALKKSGLLSSEKMQEIISIVIEEVGRKFKAQEHQISVLHNRLLKVKQYYQTIVKTQTNTNLPNGLHEILFVFWDAFSTYKLKNKVENFGKTSGKFTERGRSARHKTVNKISEGQDRAEKRDRNAVIESIKAVNNRVSQLSIEDKVRLIHKTLEDPSVDTVLSFHADAYKFIRRDGKSRVDQLIQMRERSTFSSFVVTDTNVPTNQFFETEEDSIEAQQGITRDSQYLWNVRPSSSNAFSLVNRGVERGRSVSPASNSEYLPSQISELAQSEYKRTDSPGTSSSILPPIENFDFRDDGLREGNPFENNERQNLEISFSTPRIFLKENYEENIEIQEPFEEDKGTKDFRRKFKAKPKQNINNDFI